MPLGINVLATVGFGGKNHAVTGGLMLMALKRHGGFVHASTDFGSIGHISGVCGKDGGIEGTIPFYSGRTHRSTLMINGGLAHRLSDRVAIFEGAGYSSVGVAWELAPSEGGGYVRNSYYSSRGLSFEAGVSLNFNRVAISASAVTIKGSEWFGTIGIGIRLGL